MLEPSIIKADYVYPLLKRIDGHPFLFPEKVIEDLKDENENQLHLKKFLSKHSKKGVTVYDDKVLANINIESGYRNLFPQ